MAQRKRIRRTAFLCSHALVNMAYYRAGWHKRTFRRTEDFWRRANGNFLDVAVLEWCKLFAEPRGAHSWRNVLSDTSAFEELLLSNLGCTSTEFDAYITEIRRYRDKFVAHLDDNPQGKYPELNLALESTMYLFRYIRTHEDDGKDFAGLPQSLETAYRVALNHGKAQYERT